MNYHDANRLAWNARESLHRKDAFNQVLEKLKNPKLSCLDRHALAVFDELGVEGKTVTQFCCNNGRELLSLSKLGADRVVGFDISDAFIEQGRELSSQSGLPCELHSMDVADIGSEFAGVFDIVYVSVGALGWFQDMTQFFGKVTELLKPNGTVFVYELHPFTEMLDVHAPIESPILACDYFRIEPHKDTEGQDYMTGKYYESPPAYWFVHTFSTILQAIIDQGMTITQVEEFDHDVSECWPELAEGELKLPLCFQLLARKL